MNYNDLKKDTAYRVIEGNNSNLMVGDLFWIDSFAGAVNLAGIYGGWIDRCDVSKDFFSGLMIEEDKEYFVITLSNGNTQIFLNTLVNLSHGERNRIRRYSGTQECAVTHGKWIEYRSSNTVACSICKTEWGIIDNCCETFNYCPNCGAKMDSPDERL